MKLTDALLAEHAVLRRLLGHLDDEAKSWALELSVASMPLSTPPRAAAALGQVNELARAHWSQRCNKSAVHYHAQEAS